jgi:uncharacterized protein (TIGR02147 family)
MVNILKFYDFNLYVTEYLNYLAKNEHGIKKKMCEHLNIHPSLLSQVLNGNRQLGLDQVYLLADFFRLTETELEYFLILFNKTQCLNNKLQKFYDSQLNSIIKKQNLISSHLEDKSDLSEINKAKFFSNWIYLAICSLTSFEGGVDVIEICEKLNLKRDIVLDAITFLQDTHLCIGKNGKYFQVTSRMHLDKSSPYMKQHHINWRIKSIESLDVKNNENINFTSAVTVSVEDAEKIRNEIMNLIKKLNPIVSNTHPREMHSLNIDFFKIV